MRIKKKKKLDLNQYLSFERVTYYTIPLHYRNCIFYEALRKMKKR